MSPFFNPPVLSSLQRFILGVELFHKKPFVIFQARSQHILGQLLQTTVATNTFLKT